ncbi:hypothetical protein GCM10027615_80190 [Plantactinospora veratri]
MDNPAGRVGQVAGRSTVIQLGRWSEDSAGDPGRRVPATVADPASGRVETVARPVRAPIVRITPANWSMDLAGWQERRATDRRSE